MPQITSHLINSNSLDTERRLLDRFGQGLYLDAFPEPNEREPFCNIISRIQKKCVNMPQTFAVISEESGNVVAGIVADWYDESGSLEIIYLAVSSDTKRHGIGTQILHDGTNAILENIRNKYKGKINVFFETENPQADYSASSPIKPADRLSFFRKNGAKRIPIDYVQPPLDPSLGWDKDLFLMMLPQFSKAKDSISASELIDFLYQFYKGLNAEGSEEYGLIVQDIKNAADKDRKIHLEDF